MVAYLKALNAELDEERRQRLEQQEAVSKAARERFTPLEHRLARLLATIPEEVQREGISLAVLQASLKGRWRGNCHPGELGAALRKLGFERRRNWCHQGVSPAKWHRKLRASATTPPNAH